jgi:hypothetical protein
LPFEKQIVLTRTKEASIQLYNFDNKRIDFGPQINQTYIKYDEIKDMHLDEFLLQ